MKTCIIIPCYNEEKRLPKKEFIDFIKENNIDFCFANDGSTDSTFKILNSIKEKESSKVLVFNFNKNEGKGETVRKSILKLYDNYDLIGYFDADLATPLFEIKNLKKQFANNKKLLFVMGSRFKRLGSVIDRKFNRFLFGRFFATIISFFVLKIPVYDTQCGAKLFSTNISKSLFEQKFVTKWIFDVELLLRLKKVSNIFNDVVLEYPLLKWIEKGGSKIKFIEFIKFPIEIYKIYITYK